VSRKTHGCNLPSTGTITLYAPIPCVIPPASEAATCRYPSVRLQLNSVHVNLEQSTCSFGNQLVPNQFQVYKLDILYLPPIISTPKKKKNFIVMGGGNNMERVSSKLKSNSVCGVYNNKRGVSRLRSFSIPCFYEYDPTGLSVKRITPDTLEKS